jgi:electron transport complex protein RnfG
MKPILVLTVVGICSAILLGVVNMLTEEPIKIAIQKLKTDALSATFPFEVKKIKTIEEGENTFYEIRDEEGGEIKGVAIETFTEKGFSGKISILLAVSPECKVFDYKVLTHAETPGLGDKIAKPAFRKQFQGKTLQGVNWKVKKDGGFVDALTAATISSRAITDAIEKGMKLFSAKYEGRCK